VLEFTPAALAAVAPAVEALAQAEGLEGHWRAVRVRVAGMAKMATARPARPARPAKRRPKARKQGRT
jgi:histidinol dehydrogenase